MRAGPRLSLRAGRARPPSTTRRCARSLTRPSNQYPCTGTITRSESPKVRLIRLPIQKTLCHSPDRPMSSAKPTIKKPTAQSTGTITTITDHKRRSRYISNRDNRVATAISPSWYLRRAQSYSPIPSRFRACSCKRSRCCNDRASGSESCQRFRSFHPARSKGPMTPAAFNASIHDIPIIPLPTRTAPFHMISVFPASDSTSPRCTADWTPNCAIGPNSATEDPLDGKGEVSHGSAV